MNIGKIKTGISLLLIGAMLSLTVSACAKPAVDLPDGDISGTTVIDTEQTPADTGGQSVSDDTSDSGSGSDTDADGNTPSIVLDAVSYTTIHTETQKEFLAMENLYNVSLVANGTKEQGRPLPIRFSWTDNSERQAVYKALSISESVDMSEPYVVITFTNDAAVYNLKVGTTYFWKVTSFFKDGSTAESDISSFTTEDECPRNLFVDGSTNWRDLGGWTGKNGKKVKQGLIYRTGRLNTSNLNASVAEITATGIKEAVSHLKIKTEIDLRGASESSNITQSVLGENVNYFRCSMNYDSDIMNTNAEQVRQVFAILSDVNNYPVIFHCHIGTDRTGFIAYLINGLLGVSKQDLYKDYLFSNFGDIDGSRSMDDISGRYVERIDRLEGRNLSAKIKNYLLSVGVTEKQIEAVISIML